MSYRCGILFRDKISGYYVRKGKFKKTFGITFIKNETKKGKYGGTDTISHWNLYYKPGYTLTAKKTSADYSIEHRWDCNSIDDVLAKFQSDPAEFRHIHNKIERAFDPKMPGENYSNFWRAVLDNCPIEIEIVELSETSYKAPSVKPKTVKFHKNRDLQTIKISAGEGHSACRICGIMCTHVPHIRVEWKPICYSCLKNAHDKIQEEVRKMDPEWRNEVETELFARHLGG